MPSSTDAPPAVWRRQPSVCLPPLPEVAFRSRCQGKQRMGKADAGTVDLDHVGLDRGAEELPRIFVQSASEELDRALDCERRKQNQLVRPRGEGGQAVSDESVQRAGEREWFSKRHRSSPPGKCTTELERVARVPPDVSMSWRMVEGVTVRPRRLRRSVCTTLWQRPSNSEARQPLLGERPTERERLSSSGPRRSEANTAIGSPSRRRNVRACGRLCDRGSPERRLPDPGLALEHERRREPVARLHELPGAATAPPPGRAPVWLSRRLARVEARELGA